jgi:hypothetical protein
MKASHVSIAAIIALSLALAGCGPDPEPTPPVPAATPVETPVASPDPEPSVEAISDDLKLRMEESITSDNTAALEQDLAPDVLVTIAASEFSETRTPVEAINDLDYLVDVDGWTFPIDDDTLAAAQTGTYGQFMLGTLYGGTTEDGDFVVFGVEDGTIVSIYMGVLLEYLVG